MQQTQFLTMITGMPGIIKNLGFASTALHAGQPTALHAGQPTALNVAKFLLPFMLANPLPCCPACCRNSTAMHAGQPTALHVAEVPLPCIACCRSSTALHVGQPTALNAWWTSCLNQPWLTPVKLGIDLIVLVFKCCHSMRFGFPNCAKPICNRVSTKKIKYWPTKHLRL